jgi:hypothetical protein
MDAAAGAARSAHPESSSSCEQAWPMPALRAAPVMMATGRCEPCIVGDGVAIVRCVAPPGDRV